MDKNSRTEKFLPLVIFPALGLLCCLILMISGVANPFISSFAVDSDERLYIGLQGKIEVYDNNILINTLSPKTSRSYVFTILDNDTILLSTSTTVYSMDLNGNILDSWEDNGAQTYNDIQYKHLQYTTHSGDRYSLVDILGWSRIIKNDTHIVYSISNISFLIKIMLYISVVTLVALVIFLLRPDSLDK